MAAHGMSPREREICHEVIAGRSTREIATRLFISPHTVQDHLKSIFDKAGVAHLAEGVRADVLGTPIKVTVLYPGYIRSEMNERVKHAPFMVGTEEGVRAIVEAVEKERARADVPPWPWVPLGLAMRLLPLRLARRLMG
jgi:hypothetical protein